jgi:hypothetical protein
MPILGPVFSNGGIWSGTANVTYSSTVEAAGQVNTTANDPFCSSKSDAGTPQGNFQFSGPPSQPESGVNPLILPIGANGQNNSTNVEAIINLPPASLAAPLSIAYNQTNQVYDFNAASLIVSNWNYGTNGGTPWNNNFTVYLQDSVLTPGFLPQHWIQLTNDYYVISNNFTYSHIGLFRTNYVPNFQFTNSWAGFNWKDSGGGTNYVWYAGFSFLTNASFYDFRESAQVQAVQLDVGALGAWITNNSPYGGSNLNVALCNDMGSHGINSVYVYNAVPFIGQQQLPGVLVMDGQLLPSSTCQTAEGSVFTRGLTVVTPQPLYVLGDYNVQTNGGPVVTGVTNSINTFPAAFMADSITVLACSWINESATSASQTYTGRPSSNTTVNAACLEGIVPSTPSNYSGGVENFLRLLQNWDGLTLTYNGSIIVMFQSQYATNQWQAPDGGSSYYGTPMRNWSFDTNFLTTPGLPPLSPNFRTVVRNSWSGY